MNPSYIHEIVSFSFVPGVDAPAQSAHMARLGEFARTQPGFIARQAFHDQASGRWIDHLTWADRASAESAIEQAMQQSEVALVMQAISKTDLSMGHFEQVM